MNGEVDLESVDIEKSKLKNNLIGIVAHQVSLSSLTFVTNQHFIKLCQNEQSKYNLYIIIYNISLFLPPL